MHAYVQKKIRKSLYKAEIFRKELVKEKQAKTQLLFTKEKQRQKGLQIKIL